MEANNKIALFPLGIVQFPGILLPLHIFEDRYKKMIDHCISESQDFGIVYYDGKQIMNKGCSTRIINVIKKYEDGRMDIITEGIKRFEIISFDESKEYLQAEVSFFEDQFETSSEKMAETAEEGLSLLKKIVSMYTEEMEIPMIDKLDPSYISFLIVSNTGFTVQEKQAFLEMLNTRERLEKGVKALKKLVERLNSISEVNKIIQSNGYLNKKISF